MKVILPKPIFKIERWKYSKLFGLYVSNLGNFRDKSKKPIKPLVNTNGYLTICLKNGNELAHRIVAATWLPQEDMFHLTVDHLDHNKRNNAVSNLEWVTKEENLQRAKNDLESTETRKTLSNSAIKMFADANYQCLIKEFVSPEEAGYFLKETVASLKSNPDVTIEKIVNKILGFKDGKGCYCSYYFLAIVKSEEQKNEN